MGKDFLSFPVSIKWEEARRKYIRRTVVQRADVDIVPQPRTAAFTISVSTPMAGMSICLLKYFN